MSNETQLSAADKARVFAQHIGCEVQYETIDLDRDVLCTGIVTTVRMYNDDAPIVIADKFSKREHSTADFETCQLLLTPLSKISDEDAVEVAKSFSPVYDVAEMSDLSDNEKSHWLKQLGRKTITEMLYHEGRYNAFAFNFLIQHGYAVPLFIAPGHPLNGQTAIQMGLAIDATTVNQ